MSTNKFEETRQKIASIWNNPSVKKYQTEVSEGDWTIVIGTEDIFGLCGTTKVATLKKASLDPEVQQRLKTEPNAIGELMLDALKSKYANTIKVAETAPVDGKAQLTQTFEAQLREQKPTLHPRENEVRDTTTEGQLGEKHHDYDQFKRQDEGRTAITEHQLHKESPKGYEDDQKPQDKPRTATFESQLRDNAIKGNSTPADGGPWAAGVTDQVGQIHEGQLQDWLSAEKPTVADGITEKQLRDQKDPLGRRIASKEDAKVVLAAAMNAIARTAIATGATPEELVETINLFTMSPKNHISAVAHATKLATVEGHGTRGAMLRRASFHGVNALAVATANDISNYLLGSITDVNLDAEAGVSALKVIASQKDALSKVSAAITAGLGETKKAEAIVSMEDMLKSALDSEESLSVVIAESEVGTHKDSESFAKAAFDVASKLAATKGFKVTASIHVAKKGDGNVEVEMKGVREAAPAKAVTVVDVEARKEDRKKLVEAQMPGGAGMPGGDAGGGGAPGAGAPAGGGTTMPGAGPTDPTAGVPPVSALGGEGETGGEEEGAGGEALPPGSICPVCGTDDVDIRAGEFDCNNCGATGSFSIKIEVESWPSALEDKGSGALADEGADMGMDGDMGGGMGGEVGGQEMPPVGLQASFKVTPEMVKVANNKAIGSFCPHCGSDKVKLASKSGSAIGSCQSCSGSYAVDTYVDAANLGELWATIQWQDLNLKKIAGTKQMSKKACLDNALKTKGLEAKFAKSDFEGKAEIIALLHNEGLIK